MKTNSITRKTWSEFGRLVDSKKGANLLAVNLFEEEKKYSTQVEILDPKVATISNPDSEVSISTLNMAVVKL